MKLRRFLLFLSALVVCTLVSAQENLGENVTADHVKKATIGIRTALKKQDLSLKSELAAYVDTLDKYLYRQPGSLKRPLELLGNLTLQSYYVETGDSKTDFEVIRKWVDLAKQLDGAQDDYFISCAMHLAYRLSEEGKMQDAIDYFKVSKDAVYKLKGTMDLLAGESILDNLARLQLSVDISGALATQLELMGVLERMYGTDNVKSKSQSRRLGLLYHATGELNKADSCYRVFQTYIEGQKNVKESYYWGFLDGRADLLETMNCFDQALAIYQKKKEKLQVGLPVNEAEYLNTLKRMALCYRAAGNLKMAIKTADMCMTIATKNPKPYSSLFNSMAELYQNCDQPKKSLQAIHRIDVGPLDNIASLSKSAYFQILKGELTSARKKLDKASALANKSLAMGNISDSFSNELDNLIEAYDKIGDRDTVIHYSLIMLDYLGKRFGMKSELYKDELMLIAGNYGINGDHKNEATYIEKTLQLIDPESPNYYGMIEQLASSQFYIGDFEKADANFKLCIAHGGGGDFQKIELLNSYSQLLLSQADNLFSYERGVGMKPILENAKDLALESYALCKQHLNEDHQESFSCLNTLFGLYKLMDSTELARKYLDECERFVNNKTFKDPSSQALTYGALASSCAALKDYKAALRYSIMEDRLIRKSSEKKYAGQDMNLITKSVSYSGLNNVKKAISCYNEYFEATSEELQKNFRFMTEAQRAGNSDIYRYFIDEAPRIALNNRLENDAFIGRVYDALLFNKGLLLNSTIELSKLIDGEGSVAMKQNFVQLRTLQHYLDNPAKNKQSDETSQLEMEKIEKQLMKDCEPFKDYTKYMKVSWRDIKEKLATNEVAVELAEINYEKDSTVYAAVILRKDWDTPRFVRLFSEDQIQNINLGDGITLQQAMAAKGDTCLFYINEIYNCIDLGKRIWTPLTQYFKSGETVLFSPAGLFNRLAIEYLPIEPNRTASDMYVLHRLSSTRQILSKKDKVDYSSALLVGDLVYPAGMDSLTLSKKEIERIAEVFGSDKKVVTLTGKEGTCEQFRSMSGKAFSCIHFSTHGGYDETLYPGAQGEDVLKRNWLQLSVDGRTDSLGNPIDEGQLDAKEVSLMDLRGTDLVTLSACVTGLGDPKNDGVFGLQRGFKKAGVNSIVMSLWPVDEQASELMMTRFYKNLLSGQSKLEAFRNAINYLKTCEVVRKYENRGGHIDPVTKNYEILEERIKLDKPQYWAAYILLD
jgi:CHAT domain-containing protein